MTPPYLKIRQKLRHEDLEPKSNDADANLIHTVLETSIGDKCKCIKIRSKRKSKSEELDEKSACEKLTRLELLEEKFL